MHILPEDGKSTRLLCFPSLFSYFTGTILSGAALIIILCHRFPKTDERHKKTEAGICHLPLFSVQSKTVYLQAIEAA
jgi:hypothetical protein